MNRDFCSTASLLLVALCVIGLASPSHSAADERSAASQEQAESVSHGVADAQARQDSGALAREEIGELPRRALSPMDEEIQRALQSERETLAKLQTSYASAANEAEALQIQRQIAELKQGTELKLLTIQADHFRRGGQVEAAERLEATIEAMETRIEKRRAAEGRASSLRTDTRSN